MKPNTEFVHPDVQPFSVQAGFDLGVRPLCRTDAGTVSSSPDCRIHSGVYGGCEHYSSIRIKIPPLLPPQPIYNHRQRLPSKKLITV